jgi:hypothetical protein
MLELCLALTMHLGIGDGWNERHPCARYVAEDFTVGAYLNSENNTSYYISHTFEYEQWFAEVGLVTGYSGGEVIPMLRAGYEVTDNVLVFLSPAYGNEKVGAVIGVEFSTGGR